MNSTSTFLLTIALSLIPLNVAAAPDLDKEVEALHREIASLRVVHGLDLSAAQIEEMIPLVRTGIDLRADLETVHAACQKSNLVVLRRVRDDLAEDGELGEDVEAAAKEARKSTEKAMRPVLWELKDLGEEVAAVLDDEQRRQVMEALSRMPGPGGRQGPPTRADGERQADQPGQDRMPPQLQENLRKHNARRLAGLVFSEEFLAALEDLM